MERRGRNDGQEYEPRPLIPGDGGSALGAASARLEINGRYGRMELRKRRRGPASLASKPNLPIISHSVRPCIYAAATVRISKMKPETPQGYPRRGPLPGDRLRERYLTDDWNFTNRCVRRWT